MTQTVLSGTLTGVLVLVAGTLIARFSLKTKAQESIEEIERRVASLGRELKEHTCESEQRNELMLQSLLAIMLTIKKHDENSKIDEALKELNEYIIHKGSK